MKLFVKRSFHNLAFIGERINGTSAHAEFGIVRINNQYQIKPLDFSIKTEAFEVHEIGSTFKIFKDIIYDLYNKEIKVVNLLHEFRENNPELFTKITERDLRVNDMTIKYSKNSYVSNVKHFYRVHDNITGLNFAITKSDDGVRVDVDHKMDVNFGTFANVPDEVANEIRGIINKQYFETKENLFNAVNSTIKLITKTNLF